MDLSPGSIEMLVLGSIGNQTQIKQHIKLFTSPAFKLRFRRFLKEQADLVLHSRGYQSISLNGICLECREIV